MLPHGECCATRKDFHVECANCGVRYCSESCMEDAYNAWHKTLCFRSREPDPTHPLVNLVRDLILFRDYSVICVIKTLRCKDSIRLNYCSQVSVWQSFHYPPESTSITLPVRILASIVQSDNPEELIANYMSFMHDAAAQKVHKQGRANMVVRHYDRLTSN